MKSYLNIGEWGLVFNGCEIDPPQHFKVSLFSPVLAPTIFENPVFDKMIIMKQFSPAYTDNSMIGEHPLAHEILVVIFNEKIIRIGDENACGIIVQIGRCIERHHDGSVFENLQHHGLLRTVAVVPPHIPVLRSRVDFVAFAFCHALFVALTVALSVRRTLFRTIPEFEPVFRHQVRVPSIAALIVPAARNHIWVW